MPAMPFFKAFQLLPQKGFSLTRLCTVWNNKPAAFKGWSGLF
jgi:hypothetical protein